MNTPLSVRIIAVLEALLAALCGFYCLMFLVFAFYGILHADLHRILVFSGIGLLMAAIAAGSFYTSVALKRGTRWAWRMSWVIGASVLGIGWFMLREALLPSVHYSADGYFGLIAGPALLLPALLGITLMAMPQTRRYIASASN